MGTQHGKNDRYYNGNFQDTVPPMFLAHRNSIRERINIFKGNNTNYSYPILGLSGRRSRENMRSSSKCILDQKAEQNDNSSFWQKGNTDPTHYNQWSLKASPPRLTNHRLRLCALHICFCLPFISCQGKTESFNMHTYIKGARTTSTA